MRHLSDGTLRRMYDEPLALDAGDRTHYQSCASCQERFGEIAGSARHGAALLAVAGATVDAEAALARVKAAVGSRPAARGGRLLSLPVRSWRTPALAAAVAAAMVATFAFTSLASSLAQIFQPTQVTPVSISSGDLTGLDSLATYGDVKWTQRPELKEAGSAAEAAGASGLGQINPRYLPAGVAGKPVTYGAVAQSQGTFTFSAAKATAAAQAQGKPAPSFKPGIDGSTLVVQVGPAEAAVFGDVQGLIAKARAGGAGDKPGASGSGTQDAQSALTTAGPLLAVAEVRAPTLSSTGASVKDIKALLLAQPGLSPAVRSAITSLDDPTGNLPIPIPADRVTATPVTVNGVKGTEIGDNTGLGAAVIWIKGGVVYAVAGTVSKDDAVKVAQSL